MSDPESEQTYPSSIRTATRKDSSRHHVEFNRLRTPEESGPLRQGYSLRHRPTAANAASTTTLHTKSSSADAKKNTIKYELIHTALIGRQLHAVAIEGPVSDPESEHTDPRVIRTTTKNTKVNMETAVGTAQTTLGYAPRQKFRTTMPVTTTHTHHYRH